MRSVLNKNPKTNKADLLKQTNVSLEEFNYLLETNVVQKRGKTKGAEWHWVGEKPSYEMIQGFLGESTFKESSSLLDIVVDRYEVSMKINDSVTLRLISDSSVGLRRNEGEEVVVSDPVRLKEILSLIS